MENQTPNPVDEIALEPHFDAERIAARIAEVAAEIDRERRDGPLVLISVLKGASFFLADLARRISSPVRCEYISVRRVEGSDEILQIDFSTAFPVEGLPVLLLKDVVNTGVIETYLSDQLRVGGATAVRLAAIVDKPSERTTGIVVDFPLFAADRGTFAGYGMEYRGRFGNLPYVAEIPGPPLRAPSPEALPQ
jgi:hypoxanthine phosphoribosyltransferase